MSNKNFDEIIEKIKNKKSNDEAKEYLMNSLNSDQSKKLNELLSDKDALKSFLSSPKAQELLKRFTGDKNG
ncbi:MAG: hypothetical protein IJZ16_09070 [Clostridia bacterium]|nr:hypothetical protein [Clostridia bacterium]